MVDKWPEGKLRQMARDPIAGERPSISVMFAAAAKAAAGDAVVVMLTEAGEDGIAGLKAVGTAGGYVIAPPALLGDTASQADYLIQKGNATAQVAWADLARAALKLCRK